MPNFEEAAELTTIFAKMSPVQKSRVIRALQSKGHTVGFLGDGINDAAALKDADVGISVDTAVDIAKESADIILLEKSLLVLEEAVIEGRKTFANIIKYIKMTASSNFGNVFSVLVASIFLPFLPMLPIQLLVQNLLYDISQVSIPWDDVDPDFLKQPRKWDAGGIARFMVFIGPISSIFDIVTFLVMWNVFGANTVEKQSLFQSGWFVVGLLTQTHNRAHDPHPAYSLHPESGRHASHSADGLDHGFRHLSAVLVAGRAFGNGAVAAVLFPLARRNPAELLRAHATGETSLHSSLWSVAVMGWFHGGKWTNISERSRLYVASGAVRLAAFILWLTRRLYRARLLIFADVKYALRLGERLRRLGWRLVRWKHHSNND